MARRMKGEIQTVKDETQKGGFFQTQFSAASPCLFEPLPRLIFFYSILDSSWQEFIILTGFVSFSSSQKFKLKQKALQALLTYSLRREFIIEPIARWINSRRRSPTSWSARFVFLLCLTRKKWHNVCFYLIINLRRSAAVSWDTALAVQALVAHSLANSGDGCVSQY